MTKPTVLNTRPKAQLKTTREAFVKQGFEVIDFPCIEIVEVKNIDLILVQLNQIKTGDVIVFTSQYAVRHAFKISPQLQLPNKATVITVGKRTSQVLEQNYSGNIWIPEQQNSEGVVDLIRGLANCESIKLISAENGMDIIQDYAQQNKLKFQQINVYSRQLPTTNNPASQKLEQTDSLYILATSVTTLNNLKELLENNWSKLLNQTIVCASSRIQNSAQELGFNSSLNLETANPELMAKKLQHFIASKHN